MKVVHVMHDGEVDQRVIDTGAVIETRVVVEKGLAGGESLIVSDFQSNSTLPQ